MKFMNFRYYFKMKLFSFINIYDNYIYDKYIYGNYIFLTQNFVIELAYKYAMLLFSPRN